MRELRVLLAGTLVGVLVICHALACVPAKEDDSSLKPQRVSVATKNAAIIIETNNDEITLEITKKDGTSRTKSILFTQRKEQRKLSPLSIVPNCGEYKTCISREGKIETIIEASPDTEIMKISRETNEEGDAVTDCFEFGDDTEWYGGPQLRYQHWPVQHTYYEEEPYLPTHRTNMGLAERYWLNSKGFWIWENGTAPLFLDQNNILDKYICLVARNKEPYRERTNVRLNYLLGFFSTPRTGHEYVVANLLGKPSGFPDTRMIEHPIWSTWARYKVNVSESVVNEFADEIVRHGFNNSQLEIDDNWETCYGSAIFDPVKFPNVSRLTADLKNKQFRVTLWIHPFINEDCEPAYSQALEAGYFVKNVNGDVRMAWWQGSRAATIDFTNNTAVEWWVDRLRLILNSGIDGFKFDAGEISWLPQVATLTGPLDLQPGIFTTDYVTALANNFNNLTEARVGWKTQDLPIFVRMIDKDTRWTWNNGLPTLITTLLQMNLNGYVHVLPDMIGGNGYVNNALNSTALPSRELFIRWLQANVFMPALQYSFVPWDFDDEIVELSKKFTDLHARVTPIIVGLMEKSVATGAPLNPPVWWIAPTDTIAHKINDAYLLGEEILVAPVTREGATTRDIYLPNGLWRDPNLNMTYVGGGWLRGYPAPLSVLPYFVKQVNGTYLF